MSNDIYFDTCDMREDRQEELVSWVRSLGLDPDQYRSRAAIIQGETGYELHLFEAVRDADGHWVVDRASNDVVSKPRIVDLGQSKTWPTWLAEQA